jgi:DUF4097 and DUF4098 domain-containing protein YvlB
MLENRSLIPVVCVAALMGTGCSIDVSAEQYVAHEDKTFTVSGTPDVVLKTFDGAITIVSWEKPQVAVTIERRAGSKAQADELEVTTSQTGNRIVIEAVQPRHEAHIGFGGGRAVHLTVSVPKQTNVSARSGDGAISATGISGQIELRSGDGSVQGHDLQGQILANTGDGAIALENVTGGVDVNTGDGSVRLQGAPSSLKAHTGDGSVAVDVGAGGKIASDWDITTGDGSVEVKLPDGLNASIDASTGDGRVSASDFGLHASGDEHRALVGNIGSGGATLHIRTGDGSITLSKR